MMLNTWTLTDGTPKAPRPKGIGYMDYKEDITMWLVKLGVTYYYATLYTVDYNNAIHEEFKAKNDALRAAINGLDKVIEVYNNPLVLDYGPSDILNDSDFKTLHSMILFELDN